MEKPTEKSAHTRATEIDTSAVKNINKSFTSVMETPPIAVSATGLSGFYEGCADESSYAMCDLYDDIKDIPELWERSKTTTFPLWDLEEEIPF